MMVIFIRILTPIFIGIIYYSLWKMKRLDLRLRLTTWIVFSVTLSLVPIIFNATYTFLTGQDLTLIQLLKHGELLIITVALGADAIGSLIGSGTTKNLLKITAGGSCMLVIIVSSLLYSVISIESIGITFVPSRVSLFSSLMFLAIVIAGGSCKVLSEV